jgi:hypothetical protein
MPGTDETDCGLSDDFPTPAARDWKGARLPETLAAAGRNERNSLPDFVEHKSWTTPKEQNSRGNGEIRGDGGPSLDVAVGGSLNPTWVEWLLGYPENWTAIDTNPNGKESQE